VPQSVSFFGPQIERAERKTYLVQNGLTLVFSGALMGFVFFAAAPVVARLFGNPQLLLPLRAFALFPVLTLSFNMTEYALVTLGRAGVAGFVTGTVAVLQSAVLLAAFALRAPMTTVFLCVSAWALLRWGVAVAVLLRIYRDLDVHWSWRALRGQLGFALPMGAAAMVGLLGRQLDKVIVSSNFSPERYAVYANGSYDIPLIGILTMSVTAVIVPALVRAKGRQDLNEVRRLWHGAARRVATIFFPVFVFLLIAAEPLMVLLFSADYRESAQPFRVFLLILPLRIAFYSGFLRALGRTGPIFVASAGALAVTFLFALVLVRIPAFGFLGPAIASVLGAYWAAGYAIHVATRTLGWRLREYFPWSTLGRIMGVALLAGLPALLVGWGFAAQPAASRLAAMGIAYALVYLIAGEATRVARAREWWQAVWDVLKQR